MNFVPEYDWFCEICLEFKERGMFLKCLFCNCQGGVLRKTNIKTTLVKVRIVNSDYFEFQNQKEIRTPVCVLEIDSNSFKMKIKKLIRKNETDNFPVEEITQNDLEREMIVEDDVIRERVIEPPAYFDLEEKSLSTSKIGNKYFERQKNSGHKDHDSSNQLYYDYNFEVKKLNHPPLEMAYPENCPKTEYSWVHNTCLLNNPNASFGFVENPVRFIDFHGLKNVLRTCSICQIKCGSVQKCSESACTLYMHAECARRSNYELVVSGSPIPILLITCSLHNIKCAQKQIEVRRKNREEEISEFLGKFMSFCGEKDGFEILNFCEGKKRKKEALEIKVEVESLLRFLNVEDRQLIFRFKKLALKRKTRGFTINLIRNKRYFNQLSFVDMHVPKESVFSWPVTYENFPWKNLHMPLSESPQIVFGEFTRIKEILNRVVLNFGVYLRRNSQQELELIQDLYTEDLIGSESLNEARKSEQNRKKSEMSLNISNVLENKLECEKIDDKKGLADQLNEVVVSNNCEINQQINLKERLFLTIQEKNQIGKDFFEVDVNFFDFCYERFFGNWSDEIFEEFFEKERNVFVEPILDKSVHWPMKTSNLRQESVPLKNCDLEVNTRLSSVNPESLDFCNEF